MLHYVRSGEHLIFTCCGTGKKRGDLAGIKALRSDANNCESCNLEFLGNSSKKLLKLLLRPYYVHISMYWDGNFCVKYP